MDMVNRVQILDEAVCISLCTYLWERYKFNNSLSSYGSLVGQTVLFNLGMTTSLEENSEFKPVELYLKNDLVSHAAHAEGLVNT